MSKPPLTAILSLAVAALLAIVLAAPASAASACGSLDVGVSARSVADGSWVTVYGGACGGESDEAVTLALGAGSSWRALGTTRTDDSGEFSKRVRVKAPGKRAVRIKVTAARSVTRTVKIAVTQPAGGSEAADGGGDKSDGDKPAAPPAQPAPAGKAPAIPAPPVEPEKPGENEVPGEAEIPSTPEGPSEPEVPTTPAPEEEPPAEAPETAKCPIDEPESEIGMTVSGCKLVASDTASAESPLGFWGSSECGTWPNNLEPNRPERPTVGGDTHPTGSGAEQGNEAFRRLTTFDGDDISGARCELGKNDSRNGPTAFYHEGERRVTYISIRLPENFPLSVQAWQTIMQMKQAQPANNGGGTPILFMEAFGNKFYIDSDHGVHWTFPAKKNIWTRFMWDVTYSQNPAIGSVQVAADLNDDGDFDDPGERMPRVHTATMKAETAGVEHVNAVGASIPDHLRAGIYHNSSIPCPRPVGCSTEIDNVQVFAPQ